MFNQDGAQVQSFEPDQGFDEAFDLLLHGETSAPNSGTELAPWLSDSSDPLTKALGPSFEDLVGPK